MNTGIYKIQNQTNNKLYIGSGIVKERISSHKWLLKAGRHWNDHLQRSWNKYGEESFEFEVVFYCERPKLLDLEEQLIKFYKVYEENIGYNKNKETKQYKVSGDNHPQWSGHVELVCDHCGSNYKIKPSHAEKSKYCSMKCQGLDVSSKIDKSGKDNPMYGRRGEKSPTWKEKVKVNCKNCDDLFEVVPSIEEKTTYCSKKCMSEYFKENDLRKGSNCGNSKLEEYEVREIKKLLKNKDLYQYEIANKFNVSQSTITAINNEKIWTHINLGDDD